MKLVGEMVTGQMVIGQINRNRLKCSGHPAPSIKFRRISKFNGTFL